jgi:NADPH:quinone reductase-like Zn-dependent oxidoreductase
MAGDDGTMQAVVLTGHGGPERLEVRDVAVPAPGTGQVRVRVTASSVNNTDIWTRKGAYGSADDPDAVAGWRGEPLRFPRIQGADAVGVVDLVGPQVDPTLAGRRVLVDPAVYDGDGPDATPEALLGSERDGAFAEYLVADADRVHDVGASPLDDQELAALPIAYGTAMGMLDRAGVQAGERVVVTGASGGVGIAAVQLARRLGATVIALTTRDTAAAVRDAGAHATVDRRAGGVAGQVRAAAGAVDVVVDVVGGPLFAGWPGLLAPYGRIVVAGAVAGPIVELDLRQLYLRQRRIIGSTMHTPAQFADLVTIARGGDLPVPVAATFPLARLADAQSAFRAGDLVGKVVIDVASTDGERSR